MQCFVSVVLSFDKISGKLFNFWNVLMALSFNKARDTVFALESAETMVKKAKQRIKDDRIFSFCRFWLCNGNVQQQKSIKKRGVMLCNSWCDRIVQQARTCHRTAVHAIYVTLCNCSPNPCSTVRLHHGATGPRCYWTITSWQWLKTTYLKLSCCI